MLVAATVLLVGCTEESTIEDSEQTKRTTPVEITTVEEQIEPGQVTEEPSATEDYSDDEEATEPLTFEQSTPETEVGKLYEAMLSNMSAPALSTYTAQIAVSESLEWEEAGHPMTQLVTLGATVQSQNATSYKRLLSGDYIQEIGDIRQNAHVQAYETMEDDYAAYFTVDEQWYRTDPTTVRQQLPAGFYFEIPDAMLGYFELHADDFQLQSETEQTATLQLTLPLEQITPIVEKLLRAEDYANIAPLTNVDNTIALTITNGDNPTLQDMAIAFTATGEGGNVKHESTMTFTNLNAAVKIQIDDAQLQQADVFEQ